MCRPRRRVCNRRRRVLGRNCRSRAGRGLPELKPLAERRRRSTRAAAGELAIQVIVTRSSGPGSSIANAIARAAVRDARASAIASSCHRGKLEPLPVQAVLRASPPARPTDGPSMCTNPIVLERSPALIGVISGCSRKDRWLAACRGNRKRGSRPRSGGRARLVRGVVHLDRGGLRRLGLGGLS
jgi:hypothetical protein